MILKRVSFYLGIGLISFSILLLALSLFYFENLLEYIRLHFSTDHVITGMGVAKIKLVFLSCLLGVLSFGVLLMFNVLERISNLIPFREILSNLNQFVFFDELTTKQSIGKVYFILGSVIAAVIHLLILIYGEPEWEGTVDRESALLLLFSVVLLLLSAFRFRKFPINKGKRKKILIGVAIISIIFIFIYGEEISWGQQYFEIATNDFFQLNFQQENTLHNFFNPLFRYAYPFVGFSSFIVLCYLWFIGKPSGMITKLFVPHVSLFIYFLLMAGSTYTGTNELYEAYLYLYFVFYSARILFCVYYPSEHFVKSLV